MTDTARSMGGSAATPGAVPAGSGLPPIGGLREFWAAKTFRGPPGHDMQSRLLLDVLGLGLEQTLRYLGTARPELAEFAAWIVATSGLPDPLVVARYHAWLAGAPAPGPVRARLQAIADAPPVLDAADLAGWEADGYVVLRHAITAEQAAAAEALLWRTRDADPDDTESWYGCTTNGIMVQLFQHPALDAARRSPRVHKAFAQLWGTPDLWMTTDRMSFNPPERPGAPFQGPHLHWDVSLSLPIPFATQGILYLTDTSAEQGALRVVPGFHHRIEAWLASLGEGNPRQVDLGGEAVPIAAGRGDLVIWRQDLPHGASPNRADRPRMAQYVNMYSADLESHPAWR